MATSYQFTREGIFNNLAAQRDEAVMAARPVVEGRAYAQQLVIAIEAARSLKLDVRALQAELRPLMHYFLEDASNV